MGTRGQIQLSSTERQTRDQFRCAKLLEIIAECADVGDRCPTNEQLGYLAEDGYITASPYIRQMVEEGWMRVEIYALNWRVVWILKGDHKGKHTAFRGGAIANNSHRVLGGPRP